MYESAQGARLIQLALDHGRFHLDGGLGALSGFLSGFFIVLLVSTYNTDLTKDDDLTTPLCTQLINTDGYRIQFAFYQLNTLGT